MLIENARNRQTQVQLLPFSGMVNPEHLNQANCVPWVICDDDQEDTNASSMHLERLFIDDFLRKSNEFHESGQLDCLPVEIRLGTVYTYQNRRQQQQYPNSLYDRHVSAEFLRHEEHRPHGDKQFLITFNKNKGINDLTRFEHELTCMGFRSMNDQQPTYRLYLRHGTIRLILELKRDADDPRYLSVKRLLRYGTKFRHIDVVKSKVQSNYDQTFDDVFDIRTTIGKAMDEEELHINDDYCDFLQIKDLERCVFEHVCDRKHLTYRFNRHLLPYFDFFQIKQTQIYHYSCIDSRFFGVRIFLEEQTGYDLSSGTAITTTPCLRTSNVLMAKLLAANNSDEEARRIWNIGKWMSDLATRCTNQALPANQIYSRRPKRVTNYRRTVR